MPETIKLAIKEPKKVGGLSISLDDIVTEEIAAAPGNEDSYPSGSGAVYNLKLQEGEKQGDVTLSYLTPSPQYNGIKEATWESHQFKLINPGDKDVTIEVS